MPLSNLQFLNRFIYFSLKEFAHVQNFCYFHYAHTMKTILVILAIFVQSSTGFCQDLFPVLTKKIAGCTDSTCIDKINYVANQQLKKTPEKRLELQLWSFCLYDSLKFSKQSDSLCSLLLPKIDQLKTPLATRLYIQRGIVLSDSSLFEEAIQSYYLGIQLAQKWKNKSYEGQLQRLIGLSYLKLDQHKNAENHLRTSLKIYEQLNDDLGIANACISLGNAVKEQGKTKESVVYYERSLQLATKLNNKRLIAGNYNNLGNAMRRLKQPQKALKYFFKALEMNKKSDNQLWISFNYHNIGNTYNDLKLYQNAIPYFIKSNDIKKALGDSLSLVSGYLSLSESYVGLGNYQAAYSNLLMHKRLQDTLNLQEQVTLLNDLETKYETEKKETQIKQLKIESQLEQMRNNSLKQRSEQIRNYFVLAGVAALFLFIGILFLIRTNHVRKRTNQLLNEKNNEVEASNNALNLALHELSVKNKEIIDSINYATYIQQASLPNITQHSSDSLHFELFFAPKDIVSGDFYFSYQLHNKSIFGVADCTGHGVPGAMVSLVGMNSMDKVVREENHSNTAEMVESLNAHVIESLHRGGEEINDGMDLSFCYFDHQTSMLHFTGANHNGFILRKRTDNSDENQEKLSNEHHQLIQLSGARRPIGKSRSSQPFFESNFQLKKGDRIILFTDGYADQTGSVARKKMKRMKMMDLILESASYDITQQVAFMKKSFETWKHLEEQVDDVCLLCVEVLR